MRKYPLPPLDLFHSFEAVARHRSFTRAAAELCLTQSAVSRQIGALEAALGLPLFRRLHRAVDLTTEGQRLFDSVTRGLDDISACLTALGAATKALQITVGCSGVNRHPIGTPDRRPKGTPQAGRELARGGVAFQLAQPSRASVSAGLRRGF